MQAAEPDTPARAFGLRVRARETPVVGWLPFGLLVAAALVDAARLPVLVILASGALVPARRNPAGVAWAAALPLAASFAFGLMPEPAVPPRGAACADPLSSPAVWRVLQAAIVLAVAALVALVVRRCGGARPLLLTMPPDRRVTILATLAPASGALALVIGPALARPFFGEVGYALALPWSLLPAAAFGLANATLEEVAYRGALQGWAAKAVGPTGALIGQSVIFGFAHLAGPDLLAGGAFLWAGMTAAALVAGLVARRTGSLLLPIAFHAAIDLPLYCHAACALA